MSKEKNVWLAEYEGHKIKVVNSAKARLYIDGVEAAKEKGLIHLKLELSAPIPGTDSIVTATLDGTNETIVKCSISISSKIDVTYGKEAEDGTFTPYTADELKKIEEDTLASVISSTMINIF